MVVFGYWALGLFYLNADKREGLAVKLASPSEQRQNKYSHDNKGNNNKNRVVTFLTHVSAIIKRLLAKCK